MLIFTIKDSSVQLLKKIFMFWLTTLSGLVDVICQKTCSTHCLQKVKSFQIFMITRVAINSRRHNDL